MKRFIAFVSFLCALGGCTGQTPVAQAPVYNVTITDNSQVVVGDNNIADTTSTISTDQIAKPDVSSGAKNSGSTLWMLLFGFIFGVGATISGYLIYLRYFKKRSA